MVVSIGNMSAKKFRGGHIMIDKLLKIKNVGVFDKYEVDTSTWDKGFKKNNLIYAANGQGKTTLSVIFESLAKNNGDLIRGRKTLGQDGEQKIKLLIQNRQVEFQDGEWTDQMPNIEIYNSMFITKNLYVGDVVSVEQKKNLHQFVLGEEGVELIRESQRIYEKLKETQKDIRNSTKQISAYIDDEMPIDDFISLDPIENLDDQIEKLKKEIKNLEQKALIIKQDALNDISIELPDIEELSELLLKGYSEISREAEDLINQHINKLHDDGINNWLNKGLKLIRGNKCPFCSNDITGNDLVNAYKKYFDKGYEEFKNQLNAKIKKIQGKLDDRVILNIEKSIMENIKNEQYWQEQINIDASVTQFVEISSALSSLSQILNSLFVLKKNNILSPISIPKELIDTLEQTKKEIASCKQVIIDSNEKITKYKQSISSTNIESLHDKLDKLYLVKKRYNPKGCELCETHAKMQKEKKRLDDLKANNRKDLEDYFENFTITYTDEINNIINLFGADFRICDMQTDYRGGPKLEYKISINGCPVPTTSNSIAEPQFKNTLSEGDKNTLSFAFFIARLLKATDINKKIVIIDDPITSLDYYRSNMTASVLSSLLDKVCQMFVLTHDLRFAKLYYDNTHTLHGFVMLEIKNKIFQRMDIEKAQLSNYFINYFILDDYINNKSVNEREISIVRAIRPLLEGHFRIHYPKDFKCNMWLGDFINLIRNSTSGCPYYKLKEDLQIIEAINNYSKNYHHDTNPNGADNVPIDPAELKNYVRKTLELCS